MPYHDNDADDQDESDIPQLTLPEGGFVSRIPSHLLAGETPAMQYVMNTSSKMDHFIEWAGPALVEGNKIHRAFDRRLTSLEKSRDMFKTKKGMVIAVVGGICGILTVGEAIVTIIGFLAGHG